MSWNDPSILQEPSSSWGGNWTERKLDAFEKYVKAYLTIMNGKGFTTVYFDGFAGSGSNIDPDKNVNILEELKIINEVNDGYKGAAERILNIKNDTESLVFNYYYFIDKNEKSINNLENKLAKYTSEKRLVFRSGDCNEVLEKMAEKLNNDKKFASLVLLDPFGMQMNWSSIAKLKDTRTDLWILVPTDVIVNRLLDKKGELKYEKKLESFFGLEIEEIKKLFYVKQQQFNLLGEEETITIKADKSIKKIADVYVTQLKTIFKYVTNNPLILKNSSNTPIFHFVFASNNPIALKIANHIIPNT